MTFSCGGRQAARDTGCLGDHPLRHSLRQQRGDFVFPPRERRMRAQGSVTNKHGDKMGAVFRAAFFAQITDVPADRMGAYCEAEAASRNHQVRRRGSAERRIRGE